METEIIEKYKIKQNFSLRDITRFRVGGIAKYYFEPTEQQQLIDFVLENNNRLPITTLGACSNVLIRDGGIRGVVVNTKKMNKIAIDKDKIVCDSGVLNTRIFTLAKENLIPNYEFLGTIPGTIGGSCKSNAGCYGMEIKDVLVLLKAIDLQGNIKTFTNEECGFSYRNNNLDDDLIYLEATLKVFNKVIDKTVIENKYKEQLKKREETQPYNENTCGSTFQNPKDIPAWRVIQQLGLQNVDFNGVKFSPKHANFIVNSFGQAKDIENLINLAVEKAKNELGIDLIMEVKIIGEK